MCWLCPRLHQTDSFSLIPIHSHTMQPNPAYELLHKTAIKEILVTGKPVVTLSADDTIEAAVKALAANMIQSAPVVDKKNGNEVLGMVDMLDLVAYVISVAPEGSKLSANDLQTMQIAGRAMALEPLRNVISTVLPITPPSFPLPMT